MKIENPGFIVEQATFIVDVLGGYSAHLKWNVAKLGYKSNEFEKILTRTQKLVLSEARQTMNKFKIKTA